MDIDTILADSTKKYSNGSRVLENELRKLKRNLNVEEGFICEICKKVIKHHANFKRHLKSHKTILFFLCDRTFNRIDSLQRHERGHLVEYVPPDNTYKCQHCKFHLTVQFDGNANVTRHQTSLDDSVHVLTIYPTDDR